MSVTEKVRHQARQKRIEFIPGEVPERSQLIGLTFDGLEDPGRVHDQQHVLQRLGHSIGQKVCNEIISLYCVHTQIDELVCKEDKLKCKAKLCESAKASYLPNMKSPTISIFLITLFSIPDVAAFINFSMKSRTVSQSAVKVGKLAKGVKCCKKTLPRRVAARVLVSSIAVFSPGNFVQFLSNVF